MLVMPFAMPLEITLILGWYILKRIAHCKNEYRFTPPQFHVELLWPQSQYMISRHRMAESLSALSKPIVFGPSIA
jgi:hypothetical protein